MFEIDARGKACPMPVILAKKALDAGEKIVRIRVDLSGDGVPECALEPAAQQVQGGALVLFIGRDGIGTGDETLGRNLMKMFFLTLAEGETVPDSILFMNGGVLLPTGNEQVIEALQKLQARGAEILVCGTCLGAYGIQDQLRIGTVSNMYEIQKRMLQASRVISFA